MMTKDFEKYFPLPWEVKIIDTATFIQSEFEPGEHTIEFNADNIAHVDALEYMVKCANLMPEAARLLRSADEKLLDLCRTCVNAMTEAGYFVDCKNCNVENLDTSIRALLAKLEGGAEDA